MNTLGQGRAFDQVSGVVRIVPGLDREADDLAAIQVQDQVEVEPLADDLGGQISHVPAPDLTRAGSNLRRGRLGVGRWRLSATAVVHLIQIENRRRGPTRTGKLQSRMLAKRELAKELDNKGVQRARPGDSARWLQASPNIERNAPLEILQAVQSGAISQRDFDRPQSNGCLSKQRTLPASLPVKPWPSALNGLARRYAVAVGESLDRTLNLEWAAARRCRRSTR
ncbi:MAG: hypothetical protein AW10_00502 [Candidatus Accumulibacter appositus]|uniref:Uncharacterized protein n=1 Tax=Candidatus Accumulibacter appositus TaxID=1454003 RepID=A0A011QU63_9PROT|nr:MAG: hypothetical protein AW10_00502 [Candidatus Accumulibacter appositus]